MLIAIVDPIENPLVCCVESGREGTESFPASFVVWELTEIVDLTGDPAEPDVESAINFGRDNIFTAGYLHSVCVVDKFSNDFIFKRHVLETEFFALDPFLDLGSNEELQILLLRRDFDVEEVVFQN
jgi:hypothetical protein